MGLDGGKSGLGLGLRKNATLAEAESGLVRSMMWVFEHLDDSRVWLTDAPSRGSWTYLQYVRSGEKQRAAFYRAVLQWVLGRQRSAQRKPAKKKIEEAESSESSESFDTMAPAEPAEPDEVDEVDEVDVIEDAGLARVQALMREVTGQKAKPKG